MEITVNLPIEEWYFNSSQNDLSYWGIDYPPLTTYFSYLFGKISQVTYPEIVELYKSRGIETDETIFFMRLSVLLIDLLLFFTAVQKVLERLYYTKTSKTISKEHLLLCLLQPSLILIDHGHFQYNCASLGFVLWSFYFISRFQNFKFFEDGIGSMFFCYALNFKHISLYFAPTFFFLFNKKMLLQ